MRSVPSTAYLSIPEPHSTAPRHSHLLQCLLPPPYHTVPQYPSHHLRFMNAPRIKSGLWIVRYQTVLSPGFTHSRHEDAVDTLFFWAQYFYREAYRECRAIVTVAVSQFRD
ncbi:hypothetical protein CPB83DRAFT_135920 [Crepidotus variabilis]|uniref:Uncharacterized protein n=1 Tax=Crepidotus variabilis TaxID=179855 RepID=A0A9P6E4D2_9AGAR|nr:hypothetical protein CPB83DRAFT_135920 [Crepidotus variabilis]